MVRHDRNRRTVSPVDSHDSGGGPAGGGLLQSRALPHHLHALRPVRQL